MVTKDLIAQVQKAHTTGGCTVVYFYTEQDINTHKEAVTASLHADINKEVFVNEHGSRRSYEDIAQMFIDTCHDLGAKYFEIN